MKVSTVLALSGAGLVVVYIVTRPSSLSSLSSKSSNKSSSIWGSVGQFLGGAIVGAGGTVTTPKGAGGSSSSSSGSINDSALVSAESASASNVETLDQAGIDSYDAQGTPDAPVYGIAGIDY